MSRPVLCLDISETESYFMKDGESKKLKVKLHIIVNN